MCNRSYISQRGYLCPLSLKFECAPSVKPYGCFVFRKEKGNQNYVGLKGELSVSQTNLCEETETMASKLRTSKAMIGAQSQMSRV